MLSHKGFEAQSFRVVIQMGSQSSQVERGFHRGEWEAR